MYSMENNIIKESKRYWAIQLACHAFSGECVLRIQNSFHSMPSSINDDFHNSVINMFKNYICKRRYLISGFDRGGLSRNYMMKSICFKPFRPCMVDETYVERYCSVLDKYRVVGDDATTPELVGFPGAALFENEGNRLFIVGSNIKSDIDKWVCAGHI